MANRTMVKIVVSDSTICLKTVSKNFKTSQMFYILKERLTVLEKQKQLTINDLNSFAVLHLISEGGKEIFEAKITWLRDTGDGTLVGRQETIRLSYQYLCQILSEKGEYKQLSLLSRKPSIEFKSKSNLKRLVENPLIRTKLGRFLCKNFNWTNWQSIVLIDDFVPYSFLFTCYTQHGPGLWGSIILHGQEDLLKAYYSIHT